MQQEQVLKQTKRLWKKIKLSIPSAANIQVSHPQLSTNIQINHPQLGHNIQVNHPQIIRNMQIQTIKYNESKEQKQQQQKQQNKTLGNLKNQLIIKSKQTQQYQNNHIQQNKLIDEISIELINDSQTILIQQQSKHFEKILINYDVKLKNQNFIIKNQFNQQIKRKDKNQLQIIQVYSYKISATYKQVTTQKQVSNRGLIMLKQQKLKEYEKLIQQLINNQKQLQQQIKEQKLNIKQLLQQGKQLHIVKQYLNNSESQKQRLLSITNHKQKQFQQLKQKYDSLNQQIFDIQQTTANKQSSSNEKISRIEQELKDFKNKYQKIQLMNMELIQQIKINNNSKKIMQPERIQHQNIKKKTKILQIYNEQLRIQNNGLRIIIQNLIQNQDLLKDQTNHMSQYIKQLKQKICQLEHNLLFKGQGFKQKFKRSINIFSPSNKNEFSSHRQYLSRVASRNSILSPQRRYKSPQINNLNAEKIVKDLQNKINTNQYHTSDKIINKIQQKSYKNLQINNKVDNYSYRDNKKHISVSNLDENVQKVEFVNPKTPKKIYKHNYGHDYDQQNVNQIRKIQQKMKKLKNQVKLSLKHQINQH